MQKINLREFIPAPHPYKRIFENHFIRQVLVARYLNIDPGTLSAWLNGYRAIPERYQGKLDALVKSLESSE